MMAILIGGEKGGTGKSTISTNLSIMAALMKKDVLVIDTDTQASTAKFLNLRKEIGVSPVPPCAQITGKYLYTEIEDFCNRYELIIIDAGGRDSPELRAALSSPLVKKIYSPLTPSYFDVETIGTMDDLIATAQLYNHELEAYILYNRAPTHSKVTILKEAQSYCKSFENITLSPCVMKSRAPVQYSSSHGKSIVEFEAEKIKSLPTWQSKRYVPKASMEICDLYKEIFSEDFVGEINEYFDCDVLEKAGNE